MKPKPPRHNYLRTAIAGGAGRRLALASLLLAGFACSRAEERPEEVAAVAEDGGLLAKYTSFRLTTDLPLDETQRRIVALLMEAADAMDEVFWLQSFGDPDELLGSLEGEVREFARVNYGPWDRLEGNEPFVGGVGPKPPGAAFYPPDMTREELEEAIREAEAAGDQRRAEGLRGEYSVVRRDPAGRLEPVPYSEEYAAPFRVAAAKLRAAAELATESSFRRYLELRAEALRTDDYFASDLAWMEMKDNALDVVIGPIEHYEDQLFGYKTAAEAYVLVKDLEWSRRLERYAALLPELQRGLPVPEEYRREEPGAESDLGAYDVVYATGDANAGSKTIAINLPNDERVQLQKGTRRLQLKNAMRAKFDRILVPIAQELIAADQQEHVDFDAFFANTMFHEVAHGLGIKNTISGRGTVREALRDQYSALEEGKADVLGLHMIARLHESGELADADLRANDVTFVASIFRSIRFGSASAHGVANLVRFNFFRERGAFSRDASGRYRVDFARMREAADALAARILQLQGDGDYEAVTEFVRHYGGESEELRADLDRLAASGIPVDVVYEQGPRVLGLPAAGAGGS
jgi:hypothetical protein